MTPSDHSFHIAPAENPEEHDPCKSCAERTDIDGKHIHPVRNNALDQQRSYNAAIHYGITMQEGIRPRPVFS